MDIIKEKELEKNIINFLAKMALQDNRATAAPYFYTIKTEVTRMAPTDNCDEIKYYWQDGEYDSIEDIEKECKDMGLDDKQIKRAMNEVSEYGIKREMVSRGVFLTETDANNHLRKNHYHYSKNAHVYLEHAWRAPELQEFLKSLFEYFNVDNGNYKL